HTHKRPPTEIAEIAGLYRSVCSDLMRARALGCQLDLIAHLDGLTARAHDALYGTRPYRIDRVWTFLSEGFPKVVRRSWRPVALASLLFYGPLLITAIGTLIHADLAAAILPKAMLRAMAQSYAEGFDGRDFGADSTMAGFYVYNNIGIAFRCFATGVLFGLGSLFFLVYNGLVIGAVLGYVIHLGHGGNILTFICGHGPFELTAITISGAAGLKMGWALVATEGKSRIASLRAQAPDLVQLVLGAAVMLAIAALIEGYWSPSGLPAPVKWAASAVFSATLITYFVFAGRRR
ncbi:MAG: stage II sporulation protein M, partial [Myxococcales bacterium]|nr:stage II sporulation protein M [Myxococcales bacterium]